MRILQNTLARSVGGVSFTDKGRTLVAGGNGGFDVWNLPASSHSFIPSHAVKYLYGCICDPSGRWVYVSDYIKGFRIVPVGGQDGPPTPGCPDDRHVVAFDLTRDGKRLVMSRGGGGFNRVECWEIRGSGIFVPIWSLCNGEPIDPEAPYLFRSASWFSNGLAIQRDGKMVAAAESRSSSGSSGNKPILVLRDGRNGKEIAKLGRSAASFEIQLAMAPNGRSLYAWDRDVLERWDLRAGKLAKRLFALKRADFLALAVHPSGRAVITTSTDGQVRYWNPLDLEPLAAFKCAAGKLQALALSPDGAKAAAGGQKGQVVVWDVEN